MSEAAERTNVVIFIGDRPPFEDRIGFLHSSDKDGSTWVEFEKASVRVSTHEISRLDMWDWDTRGLSLPEFMQKKRPSLIDAMLKHVVTVEEHLRVNDSFLSAFFGKENAQKIKPDLGAFTIVVPGEVCANPDVGVVDTEDNGSNLFRVRCRTKTVTEHAHSLIPLSGIEPRDENSAFRIIQEVLTQKLRIMRALALTYASLTGTQVNFETR
jgi:hypothetical protein